jgi:hypothetical protein
MSKSYSVSPVRRKGTSYYVATFKNSSGKRVTRGLGTSNRDDARFICDGLVLLWNRRIRTAENKPIDVPEESARLYFGDTFPTESSIDATKLPDAMKQIKQQLELYPKELRAVMVPVLLERERLKIKVRDLGLEKDALQRELSSEKGNREALERSALGQAVKAAQDVPDIPAALEMFKSHMQSETTDFNARVVHAVARKFTVSLPSERKTLADVTHSDVAVYLEREVARGEEHKRASRRDALRRRLGRFLNWSAKRWGYASQISAVRAVKKEELDRERGGIHHHSIGEIEAAIEKLPSDYWKTLVATLAYAGLQLAELCWLRISDVVIAEDGESGVLHVTTVDDGKQRHLLKTAHRRRKINLHPKLLLPRLKQHFLSAAGTKYVFPAPGADAACERWTPNGLGTVLRGHKGGKRRKPTAPLLPRKMNANEHLWPEYLDRR